MLKISWCAIIYALYNEENQNCTQKYHKQFIIHKIILIINLLQSSTVANLIEHIINSKNEFNKKDILIRT